VIILISTANGVRKGIEMIVRIVGWLIDLGELLFVLNLLTLLIAAPVKRFRWFAGFLLYMSGYVWAMTLIAWCAVVVHAGWGWFLTILGLAFAGVGIVPVAFFCLLFSRSWASLWELLFQLVLATCGYAFGPRLMGED